MRSVWKTAVMYLHIGNGETIPKKKIIGMFDLDTASVSGVTRDFLKQKEHTGQVDYQGEDLPRSFLLLEGKEGGEVKLSRISTVGLRARINAPYGASEE